jgi:hypothetical protein
MLFFSFPSAQYCNSTPVPLARHFHFSLVRSALKVSTVHPLPPSSFHLTKTMNEFTNTHAKKDSFDILMLFCHNAPAISHARMQNLTPLTYLTYITLFIVAIVLAGKHICYAKILLFYRDFHSTICFSL